MCKTILKLLHISFCQNKQNAKTQTVAVKHEKKTSQSKCDESKANILFKLASLYKKEHKKFYYMKQSQNHIKYISMHFL